METKLKKKYGLFTAISMVVGIVIGSGVFFKAEKILNVTGGDLPLGILAWVIGGVIMMVCSYVFAVMATKYEYVNGVVDYSEVTVGKKYGYMMGWFFATIYYPTLTSVLAWVSARYTAVLFGWSIVGPECMVISAFFLIASYAVNALSPKIAGKFQVTTTVIKLIPLLLMGVVGLIVGLVSGMTVENFSNAVTEVTSKSGALLTAVCATAFAYEGWVIATSINAELRDAKKNLPRALVIGALIVIVVYILYYVGLAGVVPNATLMENGQEGARLAFAGLFSNVAGTLLFVFVIISCLGTLNGLMMGCTRGFYSLAARNVGPSPETYIEVSPKTNMATNSSALGLLLAGAWLAYFYGANLVETSWFGVLSFDSSELPIITVYAMYIPMFIMFMIKEKDLGWFKRLLMPALGVAGCLFMVYAAIVSHKMAVVWYLVIFVAIMIVGVFFGRTKKPDGGKQ
ncbi:MAG TPA: APC family permease [Eubacteriales bacterium]|nr:APC family permease [Eubacteriales bacterium]